MNRLNGFDLVYAVTQHTINQQLQLLSAESILPSKWTYQVPNAHPTPVHPFKYAIDADLDVPFVDMNTGDASSRKVLVCFPISGGTFSYRTVNDDDEVVYKTADISGCKLNFTVNLSLAEIAAKDLSEHKKVPDAVKAQLQAFTEDMYDINHLFLNFQDVDLVETYQLQGTNNPDFQDPEVIKQFKAVVDSLMQKLRDSDNPFILGYTVNDKKPPVSNADFVPTGTTYSVYPEVNDRDRSTINYLSVTQGKAVPGAGYGIFTQNWVSSNNVQGAFVISQELIMGKLLPALAKIMKADASEFKASGATLSLTKSNDVGGHITCTIAPNVGKNSISAAFYSDFNQTVRDRAGSNVGYVDGYMKWTTTISFGFDGNNNLSVSVTNSPVEKHSDNHLNDLGKFEKILAVFGDVVIKIFSFGQAPDVFENLIKGDWNININADLSVIGANIKSRLVLPAGSKFFFKDAIVSPDSHLIMTTTIKN